MIRRSFNKTLYNNVYSQYKPPEIKPTLQHKTQWALHGLSVYKFVFTTNVAFGAALLLCLSLLLQPITFVQADELEQPVVESSPNANVGSADNTPVQPPPDAALESEDESSNLPIGDSVVTSVDGDSEADPSEVTTQAEPATSTSASGMAQNDVSEPVVVNNAASTTSNTLAVASSTDEGEGETVTSTTSTASDEIASSTTASSTTNSDQSTTQSTTTSTGGGSAGSGSTDSASTNSTTTLADDSVATAAASSTDAVGEQNGESSSDQTDPAADDAAETPAINQAISTVQTDSVFAFNKNECTEVEDGSFYCQKISNEKMPENDLFAASDATGDMEIYVIQNGEQMKVTDNMVDDASPYYDASSKTIVWHRLIDDRYQIISYDVETGTEVQVTDTSVNNMEPTRNGDYTVWQRWVQNNWEIILLHDGQETQITDSIEHDIAPSIRGDLIIWNVRSSDGTQSLMTYDIGSEVFNEIKDTDGVSVANPRMLVMYEAQYQNGDTIMKGFDLVTGEVIPIEQIPRDLPEDIPDPETTGEVRALPTNPQIEEEAESDTDLDTDEPTKDRQRYDEADLDLTASSTASSTAEQPIDDSEFDLDLRPVDGSQSTSTDPAVITKAAIPDVVIPDLPQSEVENQASSTQEF